MRTAIAVAAAIAATSVTFAVATAANAPSPTAQTSARTDRVVLQQLKQINRGIREVNRNIGGHSLTGPDSLRRDLQGYFDEANGKLDQICRNTDDRGFC